MELAFNLIIWFVIFFILLCLSSSSLFAFGTTNAALGVASVFASNPFSVSEIPLGCTQCNGAGWFYCPPEANVAAPYNNSHGTQISTYRLTTDPADPQVTVNNKKYYFRQYGKC